MLSSLNLYSYYLTLTYKVLKKLGYLKNLNINLLTVDLCIFNWKAVIIY